MVTFHVGQQVVCVDDKFKNVSIDQLIRKGQVYTVRWAGHFSHYIDGEFYGVKLAEIDRGNDDGPEGYGYADMPFRASRFRPLVKDRIRDMLKRSAPRPTERIRKGPSVPQIAKEIRKAPVKEDVKEDEKV